MLPPACRFHPTCSEYAREAVTVHGVWRGLGLALCYEFVERLNGSLNIDTGESGGTVVKVSLP